MRWTKATAIVIVGAAATACVPRAGAQYDYWGPSYHASTVGESHARGMADVIRSQGIYNLTTSQAAINAQDARKKQLENYRTGVETYFEVRQMNRQYRAAERGPRPTKEDWVRYAQMGKPKPLSSNQLDKVTGQINWPILLRDDRFDEERQAIQDIFAHRAASGGLNAEMFRKADSITEQMIDDLKEEVRDVPPAQYAEAKTFLQSLAYAATQPTG